MSAAGVDPTTLTARAQEVARLHEAQARSGELVQRAGMEAMKQQAEATARRVPASPSPAGRRTGSATDGSRRQARGGHRQAVAARRPQPARQPPEVPPLRIPGLGERVDVRA